MRIVYKRYRLNRKYLFGLGYLFETPDRSRGDWPEREWLECPLKMGRYISLEIIFV